MKYSLLIRLLHHADWNNDHAYTNFWQIWDTKGNSQSHFGIVSRHTKKNTQTDKQTNRQDRHVVSSIDVRIDDNSCVTSWYSSKKLFSSSQLCSLSKEICISVTAQLHIEDKRSFVFWGWGLFKTVVKTLLTLSLVAPAVKCQFQRLMLQCNNI